MRGSKTREWLWQPPNQSIVARGTGTMQPRHFRWIHFARESNRISGQTCRVEGGTIVGRGAPTYHHASGGAYGDEHNVCATGYNVSGVTAFVPASGAFRFWQPCESPSSNSPMDESDTCQAALHVMHPSSILDTQKATASSSLIVHCRSTNN